MTKTNKKQKAGDQKPAFSKKNDFKKEAAFQIFKESITTAFLLYMFVVFPLVLHDGYMDITITKYNFFKNGVLIYGILMCLTFILGFTDHMEEHTDAAKKREEAEIFWRRISGWELLCCQAHLHGSWQMIKWQPIPDPWEDAADWNFWCLCLCFILALEADINGSRSWHRCFLLSVDLHF